MEYLFYPGLFLILILISLITFITRTKIFKINDDVTYLRYLLININVIVIYFLTQMFIGLPIGIRDFVVREMPDEENLDLGIFILMFIAGIIFSYITIKKFRLREAFFRKKVILLTVVTLVFVGIVGYVGGLMLLMSAL